MEQIPSTNALHDDLLKNCDITSITFTVAFSLLPYTVVGRGGGGDLEQEKMPLMQWWEAGGVAILHNILLWQMHKEAGVAKKGVVNGRLRPLPP